MKRDTVPADPLAALVAAWHNRRPLARRVAPRHVFGVGVVALPFRREGSAAPADAAVPPVTPVELTTPLEGAEVDLVFDDAPPAPPGPAAPLTAAAGGAAEVPAPHLDIVADAPSPAAPRASAVARLRSVIADRLRRPAPRRRVAPALQGLQPAFAQDFLAPLRAADVASFALEHGSLNRPGGDDWPQRDVTATADDGVVTVYLRTAAIEVDGQRVRVLIGNGAKPAIVGARLSSPLRAGMVSAMLAGGAALAFNGLPWQHDVAADPSAVAAAASAPAASSGGATLVASADVAAPAHAPAIAASGSMHEEMPAGAAAPEAPPAASAPMPAASAAPHGATVAAAGLPAEAAPAAAAGRRVTAIVPRLSEEERAAARAESARLRGERPAATVATADADAIKALAASDGRHFALVTRTTRSRAASEIVQSLMDTAAASDEFPGSPRTEVMAVGSGFRAVWWPFPNETEAQRGQAALAAYGIKAEIVGF